MKRSTMIRALIEDLLTMDGFLDHSIDGNGLPSSYQEIAEEVIDYLVKQGMKPPRWIKPGKVYFNGDGEFNWEPEDEKNL